MFGLQTKLSKLKAENEDLKKRLAAVETAMAPQRAAAEKDGDEDKDADSDDEKDKEQEGDEDEKDDAAKDSDDEKEEDADSEEDDDSADQEEDPDEDEDEDELSDKEKKKAASLPPLKAALYGANCVRTKMAARMDARVKKLDDARKATFDQRVSTAAQRLFAGKTGAPLKTSPNAKADGGADAMNKSALKGRAAVVAAIKAERSGQAS